MSDSEFVSPPTSLTTPILHMACSFNGYDGVSLEMDESSRHTLRQVKKRILKELTAFNLSDLSSSKSGIETEEVVVVDSKSTSSSMRCDKTPSIDVGGSSIDMSISCRTFRRTGTSQILTRSQSKVSVACENLLYGSRTEIQCKSEA